VSPAVDAVETLERELLELLDLAEKAVRVYDAAWSLLGGDDEEERGLTAEELEDTQHVEVVARKVMQSVRARVEAHRAKLKAAEGAALAADAAAGGGR
jgi:hypothetical protein